MLCLARLTNASLVCLDTHCCMHAGCPSKPGYTVLMNTDWSYSVRSQIVQRTRAADAAVNCNYGASCWAFTVRSNGSAYVMEQGSILGFQKSPGVCTYVKKANWGNGACNCEATYVVGNTTYAGCTFDSSQRTLPDKPWCDVSPSSCDGGFDFMRNVNGMEVPGVYCTSGPFVADLSDPPSPPPMTPPSPTPPAPPSTGRECTHTWRGHWGACYLRQQSCAHRTSSSCLLL